MKRFPGVPQQQELILFPYDRLNDVPPEQLFVFNGGRPTEHVLIDDFAIVTQNLAKVLTTENAPWGDPNGRIAGLRRVMEMMNAEQWVAKVCQYNGFKLDMSSTAENIGVSVAFAKVVGQGYWMPGHIVLRDDKHPDLVTFGHEMGHELVSGVYGLTKDFARVSNVSRPLVNEEALCQMIGLDVAIPKVFLDRFDCLTLTDIEVAAENFGVSPQEVVYALMRDGRLPDHVQVTQRSEDYPNPYYSRRLSTGIICFKVFVDYVSDDPCDCRTRYEDWNEISQGCHFILEDETRWSSNVFYSHYFEDDAYRFALENRALTVAADWVCRSELLEVAIMLKTFNSVPEWCQDLKISKRKFREQDELPRFAVMQKPLSDSDLLVSYFMADLLTDVLGQKHKEFESNIDYDWMGFVITQMKDIMSRLWERPVESWREELDQLFSRTEFPEQILELDRRNLELVKKYATSP